MPDMRAKLRLHHVDRHFEGQEVLHFHAIAASIYSESGADENNTFAKFTPSATLQMVVANPDLLDKFKEGETFYVDFARAD